MKPKILLVNPAVYDFSAYDFWVKPYGMLTAAGFLRGKAEFKLFDYLDRSQNGSTSDKWGRGKFCKEKIVPPNCLSGIPRYYNRFGLARDLFVEFIRKQEPFDYVFIQTVMTYWYGGVSEVIADIRKLQPTAKIILGGNYVTICPGHAERQGADFCRRAAADFCTGDSGAVE